MKQTRSAQALFGASAAALFLSMVLTVPNAYPETYIGGQIGTALPAIGGGLKNIDITSRTSILGPTHSDLALDSSITFGAKIGHYFNSARWFGLEAEFFSTTPDIKQQVHTFPNPSAPCAVPCSSTLQGAHFRVMTFAPLNLMFRYNKTRLQPYVGIGPGIFFARIKGEGPTPGSSTSTSDNGQLGLNAKVGFEYFITRHLTAFGEWKYNYARFKFGENTDLFPFPYGFNATYSMHLVSFGIGYHF